MKNTKTNENNFSIYSSQSKNSSSSSSETVPSASYLAIYKRRKTAEQANLYVKQAQERSQRKLKLLEKSFELEKQRIVNEVMKVENKAALANLETDFDGVLLSQTSNAPIKVNEDCSNKYHLHDKISVTQNQVNNNNIKKHNLNETYHMNNLTDYINQNKNLTEINSALPDKIDFSPKHNHHHRHSLLQNNEPIDKFIDELIERKERKIPSSELPSRLHFTIEQEYESHNLPPTDLHIFDGDASKWQQFTEDFYRRVHRKITFDDNMRITGLISVLDADAKKAVFSIGSNGIFYATALKTLKRDLGNPLLVAHERLL